ncbi:MAG TPA: hypothetical protein VM934_04680 [Pyrinomonadaceae bacterium]|jgi:hypothetical protein|nr:hypothetical protein [Pyrinomonadaceae bacterium]
MPRRNSNFTFRDMEILILRVASIVFLVLMLLKLFKIEISSW